MGDSNRRDVQLIKLLPNYGAKVELNNNNGEPAEDKALKWSLSSAGSLYCAKKYKKKTETFFTFCTLK